MISWFQAFFAFKWVNLYRSLPLGLHQRRAGVRGWGLYKLNPVVTHSLKAPGYGLLNLYKVRNRFQAFAFRCNLYRRYSEVTDQPRWYPHPEVEGGDGRDIERRMDFALRSSLHHGTRAVRTHLDGGAALTPGSQIGYVVTIRRIIMRLSSIEPCFDCKITW